MSACPHCGTENEAGSQRCRKCALPLDVRLPLDGTLRGFGVAPEPKGAPGAQPGGALAPAGSPANRMGLTLSGVGPSAAGSSQASAPLGQTLVGVVPGQPARPGAAPPHSASGPATVPGGLGRTLSGISPLSLPEPGPTTARGLPERTLIGTFALQPGAIAPNNPDGTLAGVGKAGALDPSTLPGAGSAPFAAVPAAKTALGLTQSPWFGPTAPNEPDKAGIAAASPSTAPQPSLPFAASQRATEPPVPEPAQPAFGKTQLGVAVPGIAPLHLPGPSAPAPAAVPLTTEPAPFTEHAPLGPATLPPAMAAHALDHTYAAPPAPLAPKAGLKLPRGALALIAAAALLLGAAAVFAFMWQGQAPLSALVSITESGKERIDIVCETCPDGTAIALGYATTTVQSRKAYLDVQSPLVVGENRLAFDVRYPSGSEDHVSLRLPVEYRIRTDLAGLTAPEPYLAVVVEALPGSRVVVAGKEVSADAAGRGEYRVDLRDRASGAATDVETISQTIAYAITSPAAHEYKGELRLSVGVTPLDIESPALDTITGRADFVLAGRTVKDARVSAAGAELGVGADGRFAQSMRIDAIGESSVTVRAQREGLAPRSLTFRIRRVQNIRQEAERLRASALDLSLAIAAPGRSGDALVSVRGSVEDLRVDGQRTVMLVEPAKGCSQKVCLARLIVGGKYEIKPGTRVAALGHLTGKLETLGKGKTVVELQVSLLELE